MFTASAAAAAAAAAAVRHMATFNTAQFELENNGMIM